MYSSATKTFLVNTVLTHLLILCTIGLTISSLSTNQWLVTDRSNGSEYYGLLGYRKYSDYNNKFISYERFDRSRQPFYTYRIAGYILFVVLIVSILHNIAASVITLLIYPFDKLSALKYKKITLTIQLLSLIVQTGCLIAWYIITRQQRIKNSNTYLSTSYYLELGAVLSTLLSLFSIDRLYTEYAEYEYIPLRDDNNNDNEYHDPRDILYPLRQQHRISSKPK